MEMPKHTITASPQPLLSPTPLAHLHSLSPPPPPPPPPPAGLKFLPPPPPPPPEPLTFLNSASPLSGQHSRPHFAVRFEQQQDELRNVRDEILGLRFLLQAQRQELHNLRIESGIKDGSVLSMLRRLLHERNVDLPQVISEAIANASSLRDQLGLAEADYEEAEAKYNSLEWKYSRKEAVFTDAILDNDLISKAMLERQKEDPETAELTRFAGVPPPSSTIGDRVGSTYSPQAPASLKGHSLLSSNLDVPKLQRRLSLHSKLQAGCSISDQAEEVVGHKRSFSSNGKIERIEEWLLDIVENSRLQKAFYRAELEAQTEADMTGESWWEEVVKNWRAKNEEIPVFRTGDSTMSELSTGQNHLKSVDLTPAFTSKVNTFRPVKFEFSPVLTMEVPPLSKSTQSEGLPGRDYVNQIFGQEQKADSVVSDTPLSRRTSASSGVVTADTNWDDSYDFPIRTTCPLEIENSHSGIVEETERLDYTSSGSGNQSNPETPTQSRQNDSVTATPRQSLEGRVQYSEATSPERATSALLEVVRGQLDDSIANIEVDPSCMPLPPSPSLDPTANLTSPCSSIIPRQCPIAPLLRCVSANSLVRIPLPFSQFTSRPTCHCFNSEYQIRPSPSKVIHVSSPDFTLS